MSIQDLGSLGELIAAIATVATLAYLALQIRQNTESLRLGAELEMSKQVVGFHEMVAQDAELSRIYDESARNPEQLSEADTRRLLWVVASVFLVYEGQWEYYRKGHISENSWRPKIATLLGLLDNPIVLSWWDQRTAPLNDDFREYIEGLKASDTGALWSHQVVGDLSAKSP